MVCEIEYTDEFEQMAKSFKNLFDKISKERRKKILLLDKKNSFLYICINFKRIGKKNHINLLKK